MSTVGRGPPHQDLDFEPVPNLFTIRIDPRRRAVVGVEGKDGTYYVRDREGVNGVNGVRWDVPVVLCHAKKEPGPGRPGPAHHL